MLSKYLVLLVTLGLIFSLSACGPAKSTAEWHAQQGYNLAEQGRYDEAIGESSKAIELDPNLAMAYNNRAWAYGEKGLYDLAIADYNKTIELDPSRSDSYNDRGFTYYEKGEYDKAITDFNKTIELDPNELGPTSIVPTHTMRKVNTIKP